LGYQFSAGLGQGRIIAIPPEKSMGVEQKTHATAPRRLVLPQATARRTRGLL
jgi:hypothetical protein